MSPEDAPLHAASRPETRAHAPAPHMRAWAALVAWRDRRPVLSLLALALALRAALVGAATLGGLFLPRWAGEGAWDHGPAPFRYLARWDAGFYLDIAQRGRESLAAWAFSPGYPFAIRLVRDIFPTLDPVLVGGLVSLAALLACVPLMHRLTRHWFGAEAAWRATAVFLAFPGAFYLGVVYPEGMFLACVLGFFLCLAERRWLLAGALASVAAVTRPQGVLLPGVLLLALALERRRGRALSPAAPAGLALALALPALDALHAHAATGDAAFAGEARSLVWPHVAWHNPVLFLLMEAHPVQRAVVLVAVPLVLAALGWALLDARERRLGAPLEAYAYALALGVVILAYSDLVAVLRYALPVLPVFWALAAWTPRRRFAPLLGLLVALQLGVAVLFGGWFPLY